MIPGSNLLNMAASLISLQSGTWERFTGRTQNRVRQYINQYDPPVQISGSFQPVPRQVYSQLGLDFNEFYLMLYTSTEIYDTQRDTSGDIINFDSRRFRVVGRNEWSPVDGWNGVMLVEVRAGE